VTPRWLDRRLVACAAASIAGHLAVARALEELPPREHVAEHRKIEISILQPAEPPKPEPLPPEPPPVPAKPEPVRDRPRARPIRPAVAASTAKHDAPVTTTPSPNADPTAKPVFGVAMESTSQGGTTPVPVGNTTQPQPGTPAPVGKPLVAAAHEVTRMPLPQGRCAGKYTEAARAAALEGTVVLELVVDSAGRARDIQVVERLGHGLTDAASAAVRECRFTPGERDGVAVAVRIRGFTIRFVLQDAR
jgi:protein TonB